jgi:hypothetical protein
MSKATRNPIRGVSARSVPTGGSRRLPAAAAPRCWSRRGLSGQVGRLSTIVQAVAANTKGEVYLAQDGPDARVWKVGLDGIIRVVAGGGSSDADRGPVTEMHLLHAGGLALDTRGNVFVSTANAVVNVSARGMATAVAGSRAFAARPGYAGDGGRATEARLAGPAGLAEVVPR